MSIDCGHLSALVKVVDYSTLESAKSTAGFARHFLNQAGSHCDS